MYKVWRPAFSGCCEVGIIGLMAMNIVEFRRDVFELQAKRYAEGYGCGLTTSY